MLAISQVREKCWKHGKKSNKDRFQRKMKAGGNNTVTWQTFGPCLVSFAKDWRSWVTPLTQVTACSVFITSCCTATVTFSLQVAALCLWRFHYKSLLGTCSVFITNRCALIVAFSLQVAARHMEHFHHKSLLFACSVLITGRCEAPVAFSLQVAARRLYRFHYKSLIGACCFFIINSLSASLSSSFYIILYYIYIHCLSVMIILSW